MENIKTMNMLEQFKADSSLYGTAVNIRRVTPGIDGLKLVHRRIIYAMAVLMNLDHSKKSVKSASIVGEVMKSLHPHGDSSIYGALVKLVNWFDTYQPLIDKQGSFGTFQGDPPSAQRYTEARLTEFTVDCLVSELKELRNIVDYDANFDNTSEEPEFLPVKVPLPLINGIDGIGFGLKVFTPPHNLVEVIDQTIAVLLDPTHKAILIPDQCQSCIIIGDEFDKISETGIGRYTVRGIIDIEEDKKSHNLIIKSTPDQVYLNTVVEKLQQLVESGKIIGISDIIDESHSGKKPRDPEIMRLVIKLKPGVDPNYTRELIYSQTSMQKTFSTSFQLINGIDIIRFSYDSYIRYFIDFRCMTKFRYYNMKLSQANTRYHKIEAYVKVLQSGYIDDIIKMIRNFKNESYAELEEYLVTKCKITDLQARYILTSQIAKLSKSNLVKYSSELESLKVDIDRYRYMISSNEAIKEEMIQELEYIRNKYGSPRRSKVYKGKTFTSVPEGTFKVVIDNNNFIRKVNENDHSTNKFGVSRTEIIISNRDNLLLFDNNGKVFSLEVSKIPLVQHNTAGTNIKSIIKNAGEIINIYSVSSLEKMNKVKNNKNKLFKMLIFSDSGMIKKLDLDDLINAPKSGIIYTKLNGDKVLKVIPVSDSTDIFVFNKNSCIKLSSNNILEMKRNSSGSRTMKNVTGITVGNPASEMLFILTSEGKYNLINNTLPYNKDKASSLIKGGNIIAVIPVNSNDKIQIDTAQNETFIFNINNFKISSTASSGERIINKSSIVVSAILL